MRKELLIIALGLLATAGTAGAEVLATPDAPAATTVALPKKGSSMAEVEKKFGAPAEKHPAVGGDTPKHPPITRWDYADFYVIFEHDKTVDAVVPGHHPAVYNKEELKPEKKTEKPSETSAVMPAVPADAPVMKSTTTTEQPIQGVEQPAVAAPKEESPPASEAKVVSAPAESTPAPAAAPEAAPAPAPAKPAPAPSSGGPAMATPVPDSPPTPK